MLRYACTSKPVNENVETLHAALKLIVEDFIGYIALAQQYEAGNYRTNKMKLKYLHKVASKCFTLDFTTARDGEN